MYNEFDLRRARQIEVQNQALSLAKLAAAEQQQIVQGIRQVLIAMSELPSVQCLLGSDAAAISSVRYLSCRRLERLVFLRHEQRP
jgi:hypothetical protein